VKQLWTDGGCEPNPGLGGWAFVMVDSGMVVYEASGAVANTTNNRMEYIAAIRALEACGDGDDVTVYTDSRLLVDTAKHWMHGWHRNGWLKKGNKPVANLDLVKQLYHHCKRVGVRWEWVKGYSGIELNERADELAGAAIATAAASSEGAQPDAGRSEEIANVDSAEKAATDQQDSLL